MAALRFGYQNVFRLFLGPFYVSMHAVMLERLTFVPFEASLIVASIWAALLMVTLAPLCERFLAYRSGEVRFSISSILLAMVVFSLYLTPIGSLLRAAMSDAGIEILIILIPCAIIWIGMTTAVLISFADALLRAYLLFARYRRKKACAANTQVAETDALDQVDANNISK